MSQNTAKIFRCYFKLTTYFGPCSGPSSSHKSIYSRKLYSKSHKIYQSKTQGDLVYCIVSSNKYFVNLRWPRAGAETCRQFKITSEKLSFFF